MNYFVCFFSGSHEYCLLVKALGWIVSLGASSLFRGVSGCEFGTVSLLCRFSVSPTTTQRCPVSTNGNKK